MQNYCILLLHAVKVNVKHKAITIIIIIPGGS